MAVPVERYRQTSACWSCEDAPKGGARSIRQFVALFGPLGLDVRVAGLCDAGDEDDVQRGLERAGLGSDLNRDRMESLGFFVCVDDLEDELIRCLGTVLCERTEAPRFYLRTQIPDEQTLS